MHELRTDWQNLKRDMFVYILPRSQTEQFDYTPVSKIKTISDDGSITFIDLTGKYVNEMFTWHASPLCFRIAYAHYWKTWLYET